MVFSRKCCSFHTYTLTYIKYKCQLESVISVVSVHYANIFNKKKFIVWISSVNRLYTRHLFDKNLDFQVIMNVQSNTYGE